MGFLPFCFQLVPCLLQWSFFNIFRYLDMLNTSSKTLLRLYCLRIDSVNKLESDLLRRGNSLLSPSPITLASHKVVHDEGVEGDVVTKVRTDYLNSWFSRKRRWN